jgi:glycosyltransferase involved in cell wall biosynthesis
MNILIILNLDASPTVMGGITKMTHVFAEALQEKCGYKMSIASLEQHKVPSPIENKFHITQESIAQNFEHFLKQNDIRFIIIPAISKRLNHFTPQIYSIAGSLNIKVIQWTHYMPGEEIRSYGSFSRVLYSLRTGKNLLKTGKYYFITLFTSLFEKWGWLFLHKKYRIRYDFCDASVLLANSHVKMYAKFARIKNLSKFYAIGNPAQYNTLPHNICDSKQKEVLIVARMDESAKRISYALKIWRKVEKQHAHWNLNIVGDGLDKAYYQYLAKKWKLKNVQFLGWQNPINFYKSASIFMMTSVSEGWGLTLVEAQQMGVVPIAFNSFPVIHDIIQDGYNGCIIPNNNINAYAKQLSLLMQDDEKRNYLSKNAMVSCQKFSIEKFIEKWTELFENLQNIKH